MNNNTTGTQDRECSEVLDLIHLLEHISVEGVELGESIKNLINIIDDLDTQLTEALEKIDDLEKELEEATNTGCDL